MSTESETRIKVLEMDNAELKQTVDILQGLVLQLEERVIKLEDVAYNAMTESLPDESSPDEDYEFDEEHDE